MTTEPRDEVVTLTIGIPVRNGERFLECALDSVLTQSFSDFELLISDNCSSDGTRQICDKYALKDSRVRVVRQATNIGAHRNFLFVLEQARGRYFTWLAYDDYYETRDYLSSLYAKARCGFALVFPRVKVLKDGVVSDHPSGIDGIDQAQTPFALNEAVVRRSQMSHQFYGMYDLSLLPGAAEVFAEDADLRCFNEGRLLHWIFAHHLCAYEPGAVLVYRVHSDNISRTTPAAYLLVDFIRYTSRVARVYVRAPYTLLQKLHLIRLLAGTHARYTIVLVLLLGRSGIQKLWRRIAGS
jgi:glycosyltransferase involved in cell wall biosynthesis